MAQSISHNQPLWCCDYSPDGRMVAAAGTGKCIFIYDTGPPPKDMELKLRIQGKYCIFEETRTGVKCMMFQLPICYIAYTFFLKFVGHLSNIVGCKFSPDSALLITASWDTKVNIWDSISGELKRSLLHVVPPPQLVFSPHIRALSLNKFSTAISTGLHYIGKQSR